VLNDLHLHGRSFATKKLYFAISFLLNKQTFFTAVKTLNMLHEQHPTGQRVFQSSLLEFFTRINPRLAFATYPFIAAAIYSLTFVYTSTKWPFAVFMFFMGLLFWTLFEYAIHRFIFHIHGGEKVQRFQFIVHGVHHEEPKDETRLIMPPLPYMMILAILFTFFYAFMGDLAFPFLPGMMIGHLGYVYVHYKIHLPNPPRYLRKSLKHHNLHHFKYHDKCFGVSTRLWDYVFGTMPPKKS
jgi:sterol desaturase/sphingolipid hydroxylase (fatty acid hydroxylase superfamily)